MGAIKKMLPTNWNASSEEEIESIYISSVGFAATMTIHDDETVTDSFGHTTTLNELGSLKDFIERLVMSGFNVEVKTKPKKEELT